MDPSDALIVRFHFDGESIRVGNELQYVGGDEAMSCIERAKLCFVQLKGHLSDHMTVKASMKYYYLTPGKELANGLLFLSDDIVCKKMSDCTIDGRLAEVFVEYHGEEDEEESEKGGSDFQDEFETENDNEDGEISEPEVVLIADESNVIGEENIFVPVVARFINSVVTSSAKNNMNKSSTSNSFQRSDKFGQGKSSQGVFSRGAMTSSSQVFNPNTQGGSQGHLLADHSGMADIVGGEYDSDSDDSDYVLPDDSGEDDETVQLRKFARMYKKKLKDSQRFDDFIDKCYSIEEFKKIYEHCLEPVEGEEMWPVSANPRPQAPGYVRMAGRPKKNHRRREVGEAPKGEKLSKHGVQIKCGMCGKTGHNKFGCKKNPEKGKKKNAFLQKAGKKMKASEQSQTDSQVRAIQVQNKGKEACQSSSGKRKGSKPVDAAGNCQKKAKK